MIQLKPEEDSFYTIIKNMKKRFKVIILCEGESDAETLKALNRKLNIGLGDETTITHSGGLDKLKELTKIIISLSRLFRKLRLLAIVRDLDELTPTDAIENFKNSLKSAGFDIISANSINDLNLYEIHLKINEKTLTIILALAGRTDLPFTKRMIEDHLVKLGILENLIEESEITKHDTSKGIAIEKGLNPKEIIEKANTSNIESSYNTLIAFLKYISEKMECGKS